MINQLCQTLAHHRMIIHDEDSLLWFGTALAHLAPEVVIKMLGMNNHLHNRSAEFRLDILLLNGQGEVVPEHGL